MEAYPQKLEGTYHFCQTVSQGLKILFDFSSALLGPPPSSGSPEPLWLSVHRPYIFILKGGDHHRYF